MSIHRPFSRRDFLKLLSALSLSFLPRKVVCAPAMQDGPGVIILVCDALSALDLSLYGHARNTSPNLDRFAERATVYHAHYAAGNFTVPGTASLLTGTYPWTHRAFHYGGRVIADKVDTNIFRLAGNDCFRLGYSQSPWTDLLLYQFDKEIDSHVNFSLFNATDTEFYNDVFSNDPVIAYKGVENYAMPIETAFPSSPALKLMRQIKIWINDQRLYTAARKQEFPYGIPRITANVSSLFWLEDLFDGLMSLMKNLNGKTLAYLHAFPPHNPYAPRAEHVALFENDGWMPIRKEPHFLATGYEDEQQQFLHRLYDSYIFTLDVELGRLFDALAEYKILDNNYVIFTSDHGEMFERGEIGHVTPLLFEPVVRVPLIISAPGQAKRVDVTEPTSCVDILPTVLSIFGKPIPEILEGETLPGFGTRQGTEAHPIYFMDAKNAAVNEPLEKASVGMRKGRYKLIRYYSNKDQYPKSFELYDMLNDPEELHDLGETEKELAASLVAELDKKLEEVNLPYERHG